MPDAKTLSRWFSSARVSRYANAPNPAALYIWNERLAKAYLEDVAHVEVLLRNFMSIRLANDCERRSESHERNWYDHPNLYNLKSPFEQSVQKAKLRLSREGKRSSYDHITAALSMDVWRFLLVKRLEPTIWRALRDKRNGGMPHYAGTCRADFEMHVIEVYKLRNRCSHQEHLVADIEKVEREQLDTFSNSLLWIADKIDPQAAEWIFANSRVEEVRNQRPKRS